METGEGGEGGELAPLDLDVIDFFNFTFINAESFEASELQSCLHY